MRLRTLFTLALAVIALPSYQLVSAQSDRHGDRAKKLKESKKKLDATNKVKKGLEKEMHGLKAVIKKTRRSIEYVDNELDEVQIKLDETREKLRESKKEQKRLSEESAVALNRLQERRDQARRRLKQLYMAGETSMASALVNSDSFGDLAAKKFLVQRIAIRDQRLFDEVRALHKTVLDQKVQADKLVVKVQTLVAKQKEQEASLKELRHEKFDQLVDQKGELQSREQVYAQLVAEENALEAMIAQYQSAPTGNNLKPFKGKLGIPVAGRLSSKFGMRHHPILRKTRLHAGVDLSAPTGTKIKAAADGVVISASYMRGYGNCLIVDHGGGISTLYGHCSRIIARKGARVQKGEIIANVGATGLATAPHLHFEVRRNGRPENPLNWL